MKTCELCFKKFPILVKVEGKSRNLQNRKYCLECSPFGNHNTKKLTENKQNIGQIEVCQYCKKELISQKKHYKNSCNSCRVSNKRRDYKKMGIEYKGGKCIICNYSKCARALHFHHIDPAEKDFGVANKGYTRSWEKMKIELDKCVLLCSNCHAEVHENLIDLNIYL